MNEISKTKVAVPAPPKPRPMRATFLADIPTAESPPPQNLSQPSTNRSADMNFKVSEEFHRAFKAAAVMNGISMKELLEEAFRLWADKNQVLHVARDAAAGVVQQRSRARIASGRNKPPSRGRKAAEAKPDMFRGE